MWRKFPGCVHNDAGVELEIFRRAGSGRGVICGAKTRDDSSRQRDTLSAPRFYAERSSEEPAVIPFPASEDVETFKILTCGAVAMASDAGGVCEVVYLACTSQALIGREGPSHGGPIAPIALYKGGFIGARYTYPV